MGQAVVDLPDPLDSPGGADPVSADDLLSKLAGDEIDRLLAESDNGSPEPERAAAVSQPPVESAAEVAIPSSAESVDLDEVLNTADAERVALHSEPTNETQSLPSLIDLGVSAERRRSLPLFLKPLVWISSPLDPWPDQLREILGKIGVVTLINALAVIAYVFLFRRHLKP